MISLPVYPVDWGNLQANLCTIHLGGSSPLVMSSGAIVRSTGFYNRLEWRIWWFKSFKTTECTKNNDVTIYESGGFAEARWFVLAWCVRLQGCGPPINYYGSVSGRRGALTEGSLGQPLTAPLGAEGLLDTRLIYSWSLTSTHSSHAVKDLTH